MGVKVKEKVQGSGEWWVFICLNGKRRSKKVGAKRAAQELKTEIEKKVSAAEFQIHPPPPVPTFAEYAKKHTEGYVESSCKPSTKYVYGQGLKHHILPAFGKRILSEINRKDVRDFIYQKMAEAKGVGGKKADGVKTARKRSPRSVLHMVHQMSGIFQAAVEEGLIQSNPAQKPGKHVKIPRLGEDMSFLTPEEGTAVLNAARTHHPKAYPVILLAMMTGMREGEIIALQWGDIDWRGKFLEVRRTDWNGNLGTPKSGRKRRVDLADILIEALKDHRRRVAEEALASGKPMSDWVFPRRYHFPAKKAGGERIKGEGMRTILTKCLKKAGVREITFHALRHSFVSWMLQAGENISYISNQVGHNSVKMTLDVYGHLQPGVNRGAMDRLGEILEKSAPQANPGTSATL